MQWRCHWGSKPSEQLMRPALGGPQVQLQLAALRRRAAMRAAKRAASQAPGAAAASQPQQSAAADQTPWRVPGRRQNDRSPHTAASSGDARMGAREAAASVVFAYERRQLQLDGSHVQHVDAGGCALGGPAAGSAAAAAQGAGSNAEVARAADEQCRSRPEQSGRHCQHAADGETASSHTSGHLAAQLAGLRRKSVLKAQLEVSEV